MKIVLPWEDLGWALIRFGFNDKKAKAAIYFDDALVSERFALYEFITTGDEIIGTYVLSYHDVKVAMQKGDRILLSNGYKLLDHRHVVMI